MKTEGEQEPADDAEPMAEWEKVLPIRDHFHLCLEHFGERLDKSPPLNQALHEVEEAAVAAHGPAIPSSEQLLTWATDAIALFGLGNEIFSALPSDWQEAISRQVGTVEDMAAPLISCFAEPSTQPENVQAEPDPRRRINSDPDERNFGRGRR